MVVPEFPSQAKLSCLRRFVVPDVFPETSGFWSESRGETVKERYTGSELNE